VKAVSAGEVNEAATARSNADQLCITQHRHGQPAVVRALTC
jgi:hypothetical protein